MRSSHDLFSFLTEALLLSILGGDCTSETFLSLWEGLVSPLETTALILGAGWLFGFMFFDVPALPRPGESPHSFTRRRYRGATIGVWFYAVGIPIGLLCGLTSPLYSVSQMITIGYVSIGILFSRISYRQHRECIHWLASTPEQTELDLHPNSS